MSTVAGSRRNQGKFCVTAVIIEADFEFRLDTPARRASTRLHNSDDVFASKPNLVFHHEDATAQLLEYTRILTSYLDNDLTKASDYNRK